MSAREKNWEIKEASHSPANGGVRLTGVNHFTGEDIHWDQDFRYGVNAEYDFSGCDIKDDRARAHLVRWGVVK